MPPKNTRSDVWDIYKEIILYYWLDKNYTKPEVIDIMARVYGFRANADSYRFHIEKRWKEFKNGQPGEPTVPRTRPKALGRILFDGFCQDSASRAADKRVRWLGQDDKASADMMHQVHYLISSLFGFKERGWQVDGQAGIKAPVGVASHAYHWETAAIRWQAAGSLAHFGHYGKLGIFLKDLMRYMNSFMGIIEPSSVIGFWRTCADVVGVKLRHQKPRRMDKKDGQPLHRDISISGAYPIFWAFLSNFLSSLSTSGASTTRPCPQQQAFIRLVRGLSTLAAAHPHDLKCILEIGYLRLIEDLDRILGPAHAITCNTRSNYSLHWNKQRTIATMNSILNVPLLTKNSHESQTPSSVSSSPLTVSGICAASILAPDMSEDAITSFTTYVELASRPATGSLTNYTPVFPPQHGRNESLENMSYQLLQIAKRKCLCNGGPVANPSSARAIIVAADILATIYLYRDFDFYCTTLEEAVSLLHCPDMGMSIWAAHFSHRLCLGYKQKLLHTRTFETRHRKNVEKADARQKVNVVESLQNDKHVGVSEKECEKRRVKNRKNKQRKKRRQAFVDNPPKDENLRKSLDFQKKKKAQILASIRNPSPYSYTLELDMVPKSSNARRRMRNKNKDDAFHSDLYSRRALTPDIRQQT